MMPYCEYKRCSHVAEITLGDKVKTGGDFGKEPWEQVVWLCPKHYKKIMLLLGRMPKRVKEDLEALRNQKNGRRQ